MQACVVYQLSDGNIVYQNGASSTSLDSPCTKNQTELKALISKSFHIGGRAMCCMSHGCNDMIPRLWQSNPTKLPPPPPPASAKDESRDRNTKSSPPQSDHLKQTSSKAAAIGRNKNFGRIGLMVIIFVAFSF